MQKNHLNKNLLINLDGFSWNLNSLLYLIVTRDVDVSLIKSKIYSNELNLVEFTSVKKIKELIIRKKSIEFLSALDKMNVLNDTTISYETVKQLLKIYINLLR